MTVGRKLNIDITDKQDGSEIRDPSVRGHIRKSNADYLGWPESPSQRLSF
jgi:hypothetical protein